MNESVQLTEREAGRPTRESFEQAASRLRALRPLHNRRLLQASTDLQCGRIDAAAKALGEFLDRYPGNADAMMLLAQAEARLGRSEAAAELLARCVDLAPGFAAARFEYAKLLARVHRYGAALSEAELLLSGDVANPLFRQLKASILCAIGEDEQALVILRELALENPDRAESWVKYGDTLRVTGSHGESVAAYRQAIRCRPWFGAGWWSLANLKTFCFNENDVHAIEEQLGKPDIPSEDRISLLFSLGKAWEDQGDYRRAFECYAKGNAGRRLAVAHDEDSLTSHLSEQRETFTSGFFQTRSGSGCDAPGPIFILGRPRSGSTLIEQILASHSAIEGTAELPYLAEFAVHLADEKSRHDGTDYPEILAKFELAALTSLGNKYLESARIHRKTDRPLFIDKAPANYHHVAMIHLILPKARIIDARRHPVATCLSMFKHNYTDTNLRLAELGRVYRDYVALMEHFDRVLPGRIHRVIYEELIADPEAEIRRMLDYLGLPFEKPCLRFYETGRAVRSPSSEQVRRPISNDAVDYWRHFQPWLDPLLHSLGSVATVYPHVPDELR
jgi:tetratricopeptide (TPR) repeat protein